MRGKHQSADRGKMVAEHRALAFILALAMLCVMLPSHVLAEDSGAGASSDTGEYAPDTDTDIVTPEPAPEVTTEPMTEPAPEEEPEPAPEPAPVLRICTISDNAQIVTVTGLMPEGAVLAVEEVEVETARELLGKTETVILFAYDIRIMSDGTEYQPTAENPVTVTITPPEPIEASTVEVVHIAEDGDTGETTPQSVATVTPTENKVEFEAEGFSVYIGTTGSGVGITLSPDSGYMFYSDAGCGTEIPSGTYLTTLPKTIYLKANDHYTIASVAINNEGGTVSSATAENGSGIWTLTFPDSLTLNQLITVTTYVRANGGTISSGSTAIQVAAMFDATATTAETDNVSVTGSNGTFTVHVKNNILLKGGITVAADADVTLTTSGALTVKRDVAAYTGIMFTVRGTLSFGTGTGSGGTVTYIYSDATTSAPLAPNDAIPTPPVDANIVGVTVVKNHSTTTVGTLIIDGGAVFTTPINTATKATPVCSTPSTKSIVESSGMLKLWGRVTLQNTFTNLTESNDGSTDAGVRITNGTFYMYGGTITQCSTMRSASFSDGGGICFTNGNAYFYGGEITQCCADNGAAVAIFGADSNRPTAYYLGTDIYDNLANNDRQFPGQACSAYNGAAIRMFAGRIVDNKNTYDVEDDDANYDMKPSGTNSGVNLFGGTIGKLGVVSGATVNVYSCNIEVIQGSGTVKYSVGYPVTIPDCVPSDGITPVVVTVDRNNGDTFITYQTLSTTGIEADHDLVLDLPIGTYEILITSASMQKNYSVTVLNTTVTATPESRTMTAPVLMSRTSNSVNLVPAGTGNPAADGIIYYGYSSTNNKTGVPQSGDGTWQTSPTFSTSGLTGNMYFFIKVVEPSTNNYNFTESISSSLAVNFDFTSSILINVLDHSYVPIDVDKNTTLSITTTPTNYDPECIHWSILDQEHLGTTVSRRLDGNGSLKIDAAETATTFTVTVELLASDKSTVVASDTITVAPIHVGITFTVMIPETVEMTTANFSITGELTDFTDNHSLAVAVTSDFTLSCGGQTLNYALSTTPGGTAIISGGTVATFAGNGSSTVSVYYSVTDTPRYSGIYTDTLTFTVSFINGS